MKVELRKSVDTRAGSWLLGIDRSADRWSSMVIYLIIAVKNDPRTSARSSGVTAFLAGLLLPVLGIMLVTRSGASAPPWRPSPSSRTAAGSCGPSCSPASLLGLASCWSSRSWWAWSSSLLFSPLQGRARLDLRRAPACSASVLPDLRDGRRLRACGAAAQHAGRDRGVRRLQVRASRLIVGAIADSRWFTACSPGSTSRAPSRALRTPTARARSGRTWR